MLKDSKKFRLQVENAINLSDDFDLIEKGKGKKFVSRFIEPGVVSYQELGDVLIKKETIDKFLDTIISCPVIINHKDVTEQNVKDLRVGVVSDAWYNEKDGWFYCSGIIFDKQAIDLIKNQGWSVSCTYDFESDRKPLIHNGKELAMEFKNGEFLHLALVNNPRYDEANIVMNSKDTTNEETSVVENNLENIETNSKGDTIMTVLNELKDFIKSVVSNEKGEEMTDKRKLIDEVAGMMKSAGCDDEIIRTAIEKMEKIGYEKSEADTADNKCKNADEEEKEEKFEEEKEIAENKKAKNEDEEEKEEDKKEDEEKAENKCKNSMDEVREIVNNSFDVQVSSYVSRADRLKLGDNY